MTHHHDVIYAILKQMMQLLAVLLTYAVITFVLIRLGITPTSLTRDRHLELWQVIKLFFAVPLALSGLVVAILGAVLQYFHLFK